MISQIWTIGHSTRKIDISVSLLEKNGIKLVGHRYNLAAIREVD